MNIEQQLFKAATNLIESRYPTGWGGAAAIRLENGAILTSVAPDVINDALNLCMEVGAYLEANKLNVPITHSLCIHRESENDDYAVLTPCGICQERLVFWGKHVHVAVSNPLNELVFMPVGELMPHHWSQALVY